MSEFLKQLSQNTFDVILLQLFLKSICCFKLILKYLLIQQFPIFLKSMKNIAQDTVQSFNQKFIDLQYENQSLKFINLDQRFIKCNQTFQFNKGHNQINQVNQSNQYIQPNQVIQLYQNIQASQANQATHFCLNQKCEQRIAFTCSNSSCRCKIIHKKCQKGDISMALQIVKEKLQEKQKIKQSIDSIIQDQIARLCQLRQSIVNKFQENQHIIDQKQIQMEFHKLFINKSNRYLTKDQNYSILWDKIVNRQQNQPSLFDQIGRQLAAFSQSIQSSCQSLQSQIFKTMNNLKTIKNSLIIDSAQKYDRLVKMFPKKIASMNVLFKASEHNFSIKQYYERCGAQTNTIVICLTNKDKIIGGFTPLSFNPDINLTNDCYIKDQTRSSFLFSLTNNEKFRLKNDQRAIQRRPKKNYISFGKYFAVCDNANTLRNSHICLDRTNYNFLEYKNDKQSNLKVNGNQTHQFTTKQWEVIKVQFSG